MILRMKPLLSLENCSICSCTDTTVLNATSLSYFLVFLLAMKTTLSALRMILWHFFYDNSNSNSQLFTFTYLSKIQLKNTLLVRKYLSEWLQEEFLNFERLLIRIHDFKVVFIVQPENQWTCWTWQISGFWFQEQLEFIHHWIKGEIVRH